MITASEKDAVSFLQIKADRDGFLLIPHPEAPLRDVVQALQQKIEDSRSFFQRSKMILDLGRRALRIDEVQVIRKVLQVTADVVLAEVRLGEDLEPVLKWASEAVGVPVRAGAGQRPSGEFADREMEEKPGGAVIVRSTCRSGTRIESPADCVVLGDVNPGAEVLAVGDIVVFGSLRGVAHAGMTGDRSARIWALSIEPNQLRIADLVALPPRSGSRGGSSPKRFEVAEITADHIEVVSV